MKRISLDYLAAMVDGEGTIGCTITKRNSGAKFYYVRISVGNTCFKVIKLIHKQYGGITCIQRRNRKTHKVCYRWYLCDSSSVLRLLLKLKSRLIIKDKQACLGIRLLKLKRTREILTRRINKTAIKTYLKFKYLNRRVTQHQD